VRDLLEIIDESSTEAAPTLATVVSASGGRVVCHIDGERFPRTVGFARNPGVRYRPNDRVRLTKTRSGEWIVDGLVSALSSVRPIDEPQLGEDSVTWYQLRSGTVGYGHLTDDMKSKIDLIGTGPDLSSYAKETWVSANFTPLKFRHPIFGNKQMTFYEIFIAVENAHNSHFSGIWGRLDKIEKTLKNLKKGK
jgi:hypothetical protein